MDKFIYDVACLTEHQGRGKGLLAVPQGFYAEEPGYTPDSNTAVGDFLFNRPFPGSKNSHLQNEAKCKNEFYLLENKKSFSYQWLHT